jgi:hypothetical protein
MTATGTGAPATDDAGFAALPDYAWLFAAGLLVTGVLTFVLGGAFLAYGSPFGLPTDFVVVLQGYFVGPVAWTWYMLHRGVTGNRVALSLGAGASWLLVLASGTLIVANTVLPALSGVWFFRMQVFGFLVEGGWLVAVGAIGVGRNAVSERTAWAALVAGTGTVAAVVAVGVGVVSGSQGQLARMAFGVAGVSAVIWAGGFCCWTFWLGRELRASLPA